MIVCFLCICLSIVLGISCGLDWLRRSACECSGRGIELLDVDDKAAVEQFTRAISIDRGYAEAYTRRGMAYQRLCLHDQARADFNEGVRLDPKDPKAYFNRACFHSYMGEMKEAISDCSNAIALDSRYKRAYLGRGVAQEELGYYIEGRDAALRSAIADYSKAIQLDSHYALAYFCRSMSRSSLGDKIGARTDYMVAVALEPEMRNWHWHPKCGLSRSHVNDKVGQ